MRESSKNINEINYEYDDEKCEKLNISKNKSLLEEYNCISLDSNFYTVNLIYFFSCISLIFILIFLNLVSERSKNKTKGHQSILIPEFFSLKEIQSHFFSISISIIIITGLVNVWNFSIILLQRFSVPELSKFKFVIYFMIIIGLLTNCFLAIFGVSSDSKGIKDKKVKYLNISFNITIYLLFILSNIIYAFLSWLALELLMHQNCRLEKNMRISVRLKTYVLFLELLLICVYIFTIITYNSHKIKKHEENYSENDTNYYNYLKFSFFVLPYMLFVINAFLNLTYYSEIIKIQDHINIFVDKEFFISNEEHMFLI